MNERIIIFLLFLGCWSVMRIAIFVLLTLADFKNFSGSSKEFFKALGLFFLGIITMPFTVLFQEWWFFLILTFIYFLLGGGAIVFWVLVTLAIIVANLPTIIGFFIIKK